MSFIPKNPLNIPIIENSSPSPMSGTRGLFAKEDGWYDIDSSGNVTKIPNSFEIPSKVSQLDNDSGYVKNEELDTAIEGKVDKVEGKGLSTNDLTDEKDRFVSSVQYIDTATNALDDSEAFNAEIDKFDVTDPDKVYLIEINENVWEQAIDNAYKDSDFRLPQGIAFAGGDMSGTYKRRTVVLKVGESYKSGWTSSYCQYFYSYDSKVYIRYLNKQRVMDINTGDYETIITYSGFKCLSTIDIERIKYYGDPDIIPSDASYFTVNETGETITGLTDTGKTRTKLVIPYKINGVEITTLYSGNYSKSILDGATDVVTKVIIPNSVTDIGTCAFKKCTSLASINIPNSITSIGNSAFENCSALTSINIPNSVISIGISAFNNCTSLTSIEISNSVTNINSYAFSGCTSLTSIEIPNNITNIRNTLFSDCTSLRNVIISNSVTNIENYAFRNCTSLTSITIPNNVTNIGHETFKGCTSLTNIEIPNSVTNIGINTFGNCTNLTIYCEQGSYAETYANDNNIPVVYTDVSATELDNKADKATTLSGYGITDAYTKTEVEAYINETILGGAW